MGMLRRWVRFLGVVWEGADGCVEIYICEGVSRIGVFRVERVVCDWGVGGDYYRAVGCCMGYCVCGSGV